MRRVVHPFAPPLSQSAARLKSTPPLRSTRAPSAASPRQFVLVYACRSSRWRPRMLAIYGISISRPLYVTPSGHLVTNSRGKLCTPYVWPRISEMPFCGRYSLAPHRCTRLPVTHTRLVCSRPLSSSSHPPRRITQMALLQKV